MPHMDSGLEYEVVSSQFDTADTNNRTADLEAGPEPGDAWDIRSIRARLETVEETSAGQFTRFLSALQVGFKEEPLVAAADLDTFTEDARGNRLLYHNIENGYVQIIDTTNGVGAGGNPIEMDYTDFFGAGELVLPYPGELTVIGSVQNNLGGAPVALETQFSLSVEYQLLEGEGLVAHGVT